MTRFAGYSGRGSHPALATAPEYGSDNYFTSALENGGFLALAATCVTGLFRRGNFSTTLIRRASYFPLLYFPWTVARPRLIALEIEKRGEKTETLAQPYVRNLGTKLEFDDFAIGGAILGLLASSRFPNCSIRGPRRLFGFAAVGAGVTLNTAILVYPPLRGMSAEYNENAKRFTQWLAEKPISFSFPGGSVSASGSATANTTFNANTQQQESGPSQEMLAEIQALSGTQDAKVESRQQPHMVHVDEFGNIKPIPLTDYTWSPGSYAEAVSVLEKHIQQLSKDRDELRLATNYLWMAISANESKFYCIPQGEEKEALRGYLHSLNLMHVSCFTNLATLSWMIADSQKNLKQLSPGWGEAIDDSTRATQHQHYHKVHEDIVAGTCKTQQARMETVQNGMRWADEQIRASEKEVKLYRDNIRKYKEMHSEVNWPSRQEIEKITAEFVANLPVGNMLTTATKLKEQASEELSKLREQHWNRE